MGKGDKKTRRGKILMGSHGVRRPRRKLTGFAPPVKLKEDKSAGTINGKAPAKPKPVKEDVEAGIPVITAAAEDAVKPARKKTPPKKPAKKETT